MKKPVKTANQKLPGIRYRIPWWMKNAIGEVENALIRKILGRPMVPGGLEWFEKRFSEWKLGGRSDKNFLVDTEIYISHLHEASEYLFGKGRLYTAMIERATWLENGDVEWTEEIRKDLDDELERDIHEKYR